MITPKGYYCDVATREEHPILIMDADEIKEREDLRIANTSERLRARALHNNVANNGHGIKFVDAEEPLCLNCGRNLHGYRGNLFPRVVLCRYCDPEADSE